MSYSSLKAALIAQLQARTPGLVGVLPAEPRLMAAPALLVLGESLNRQSDAQETTMRYTWRVRLAVNLIDPAAAEAAIDPYVNAVPAAIDADPFLGGAISDGLAACSGGTWGYWFLDGGKIVYRVLDFIVAAQETAPWQSGV